MNIKTTSLLPPALLFQGAFDDTQKAVEQLLCSLLCPASTNQDSCFCHTCASIQQHTNQSIMWLNPEEDYTAQAISCIFEKTHFILDDDDHFFFLLPQAEALSPACANRLLKIIEEPPSGYHFFLLTTNIKQVLPTITSRCIIHHVSGQTHTPSSCDDLLSFFLNQDLSNAPLQFEQALSKRDLSADQAALLINDAIALLQKKIVHSPTPYHATTCTMLCSAMQSPPAPGSATLFLKLAYMSLPRHLL